MGNDTEELIKQFSHDKASGHWQLNAGGWAGVYLIAAGIILFTVSFISGLIFRGMLTGEKEGTISISAAFFPAFLATIAATIILHEAIHGLLFLVMGSKPRFGFRLLGKFFPVAYVTSNDLLSRNRYLVVALGPLLILSTICFVTAVMSTLTGIMLLALSAMAMNISGAIGDIAGTRHILKHSRDTFFQDTEDGFNWYSQEMPSPPFERQKY